MVLNPGFGSGFDSDAFGTRKHAQALLFVNDQGPDPMYRDGDILCVMNNRRIRQVHMEHLCHPRVDGKKVKGLACNGYPLLQSMLELTKQYKYERVSNDEVLRTNLRTLDTDTLSPLAVDPKLRMAVVQTCNKMIAADTKSVVFGVAGSEVWYGGRTYVADDDLGQVWTEIETNSSYREENFISFPWGRMDGFAHLAITINNMSDARAHELVEADVDNTDPENPITVRRRRFYIPWQDLPDMKSYVDDVQNTQKYTDLRGLREYIQENHTIDKLV
jgi:hypothetical protein